ncbi:PD40 domain-containing protein [Dictyobacter formicarum]|uniref:Anaphase-promoting complex subunit 4 WD40 domain-containing protein n=1 Tax=Dictyobacter formicarum TaxID=2778368 RepID=A0ABQ3VPQ6_9CHLR|nr:PD40 domain-containing protein [Dictyobacter formicarum]GHO87654.1 hypothetical protein KSZ_56600 [Dictyobacter formicarum]
MALAWSPDNKLAALLLRNSTWSISAWDIKENQSIQRLSRAFPTRVRTRFGDTGNQLSWSPDGKYLAIGVGNSLWIENQLGDAILLKQDNNTPWTLAWSPDSKLLALLANGGNTIEVWIAATAGSQKVGTFTDAHNDTELGALAWSTDSKSVLAVDRYGSTEENSIVLKSWHKLTRSSVFQ